ncbi:hypothetical protein H0H93_001861 [Arthromyces matolae]|nr:hypothetical protein H0H93_001861 [Arthromyces matolae]
MQSQLLPYAKRQLKKIMVVDGDALSSLVDPAYSHFRLPGNIQTEKDTEDSFKATFLDGINGILRYEQARQELQRAPKRFKPNATA